ncbi:MAG: restriction endonuclease subunit S [Verrucomicrobiota bacterium]
MKLNDVSQARPGYLSRSKIEPNEKGSHFLLQIRDFDKERRTIDASGLFRFFAKPVKDESLLQDGDVIFLAKGARNFAAAVQGLPYPCLAASYFFVLRPLPKLLPAYLAWQLNQEPARQHFAKFGTSGAHMPVVRREVLENLEIPLPNIEQQRKIVAIDQLARQQTRLLAQLADKKLKLAAAICQQAARANP